MKLEEHINILKALRIPFKAQLVRILYTIFEDHKKEIEAIGIDQFITMIYPPRPQLTQIEKPDQPKAVISVGELVRKAKAEGITVTDTKPRRPYRGRQRRSSSPFYSTGDERL